MLVTADSRPLREAQLRATKTADGAPDAESARKALAFHTTLSLQGRDRGSVEGWRDRRREFESRESYGAWPHIATAVTLTN